MQCPWQLVHIMCSACTGMQTHDSVTTIRDYRGNVNMSRDVSAYVAAIHRVSDCMAVIAEESALWGIESEGCNTFLSAANANCLYKPMQP